DDQPLARVERVAGDMLVLGEDPGRGVEHEKDRVGPLHGVDSPQEAVALEPVAARRLAADARGVDQDHRNAVEYELGIDRVPRGPRRWADQRAFGTGQPIQDGLVADV